MAATDKDVQEIHAKLGTIFEKIDVVNRELCDLHGNIEVIKAHCQNCGKIVFGNGNASVDARLTKLETRSTYQSKWFWLVITMAGTGMAGFIGSIVTLITNHMQ